MSKKKMYINYSGAALKKIMRDDEQSKIERVDETMKNALTEKEFAKVKKHNKLLFWESDINPDNYFKTVPINWYSVLDYEWMNLLCNTKDRANIFYDLYKEKVRSEQVDGITLMNFREFLRVDQGRGTDITFEDLRQAYATDFFEFKDLLQEMFLYPLFIENVMYIIDLLEGRNKSREGENWTLEYIYHFYKIHPEKPLMHLFTMSADYYYKKAI